MTESLSQDEEAAILERYTRNALAIKELEEEQERLKQFFKDRPDSYPAGTHVERGKFYIKVSANTRIDQKLADNVLDLRTLNRVTKKVIDPKLARRLLPDDVLNKITKRYENRIEIGLNPQ